MKRLVELVEAIYAVEEPVDGWLRGVLEAARPVLDRGEGIGGVAYDLSDQAKVRVFALDGIGITPEWLQAGVAMHQSDEIRATMHQTYRKVVGTNRDVRDPRARAITQAWFERYGYADDLVVSGYNASGIGCALHAFSRKAYRFTRRDRELFARVALHLAAGSRLLHRLSSRETEGEPKIEAVLDPEGKVHDASAPAKSKDARAHLAAAVRRREWARGPARADPARALPAWKGLVAQRWSLVDQFESDGRRYVLARENEPSTRGPRNLSARERQVASLAALGRTNKEIAYELGLAHATVRVLLSRAAAKLGARTRRELVLRLLRTKD
jgi:DNA-binding CsgD family transcriptional regulator